MDKMHEEIHESMGYGVKLYIREIKQISQRR